MMVMHMKLVVLPVIAILPRPKGRSLLAKKKMKFLTLEQPRSFGNHFDALEIDQNDIEVVTEIFKIDSEKIYEIAKLCAERIIYVMSGDFTKRKLAEWRKLDLSDDNTNMMEKSIMAFKRTVPERTKILRDIFEKACPKNAFYCQNFIRQ